MNRFTREMPKGKAIAFLRGMWAAAGRDVPNDEQAIEEWTDRLYCVRSRYSDGSVVVYTHGATAAGDSEPLPSPIVEYLAAWDDLDRLNEAFQQRAKRFEQMAAYQYEGKGAISSEELRGDLGSAIRSTPLDRCAECLDESSAHCDRLTKDLHQIAAQLGIPTDDLESAIWQRLDDLLNAEQWFQMYSGLVLHGDIQEVGNRAKSLSKIADQIGIVGLSDVNGLEAAICQRLDELLKTEQLHKRSEDGGDE